MEQNKQLSLHFASISGKKITADFTGGDVTSDVGVLVMREIADKIGIIEQLAQAIHDERHQSYVKHEITELLIQRIFQIICWYEDANDANDLRIDRTSCHSFIANCFRLIRYVPLAQRVLHSSAYVIMHTFREKALSGTSLANAQFDTIRL